MSTTRSCSILCELYQQAVIGAEEQLADLVLCILTSVRADHIESGNASLSGHMLEILMTCVGECDPLPPRVLEAILVSAPAAVQKFAKEAAAASRDRMTPHRQGKPKAARKGAAPAPAPPPRPPPPTVQPPALPPPHRRSLPSAVPTRPAPSAAAMAKLREVI